MSKGSHKAVTCYLQAFLVGVFLVSCAHSPNITGKWQEPGNTSSIEFRRDGTFTAIDNMGMNVTGKYTLQAHGKIRLAIKHANSSDEIIIGNFAVQDDELVLALDEDKEVLTYRKINNTIYK